MGLIKKLITLALDYDLFDRLDRLIQQIKYTNKIIKYKEIFYY